MIFQNRRKGCLFFCLCANTSRRNNVFFLLCAALAEVLNIIRLRLLTQSKLPLTFPKALSGARRYSYRFRAFVIGGPTIKSAIHSSVFARLTSYPLTNRTHLPDCPFRKRPSFCPCFRLNAYKISSPSDNVYSPRKIVSPAATVLKSTGIISTPVLSSESSISQQLNHFRFGHIAIL